ncbi:RteC domain-containing protein [Sphingobacterium faecium]|uniref:RteC domain-containing protein n=1 Tax=Sphingobacterium faecium TaxID=34087 RepID=UPI0024688B96|nr:RteC domain-containing protein [Sphingobacterium faecium]MDH5827309.1 RteC domain-containing protein [Sphingobacterium faecium]
MNQTLLAITEEINVYIKNAEENFQYDYSKITEMSIQYISKRLEEVKQKFENSLQINPNTEIFYFKHIKCHLLALIQYYSLVQEIELNKAPVKKKGIKKYYLKTLFKVKKKLTKNKFFYNYFKSNSSQLDNHFFRRIDHDLFILSGGYLLEIDKNKNTPTVHLFVQMEAYEMLRHYLKKKIKKLGTKEISTPKSSKLLKWTTSKIDLIESIYALHAAGVFNNGKADLKDIAEYFQQIFDIDLGQYNRVFYDIRSRKNNKTKFVDSLKDALSKRIKDTDNELFP